MKKNDLENLKKYVGNIKEYSDIIDEYPIKAMSALLDRDYVYKKDLIVPKLLNERSKKRNSTQLYSDRFPNKYNFFKVPTLEEIIKLVRGLKKVMVERWDYILK